MTAYYNDFDAGACAWLEELIRQGHIAPGVVDNRSILDVKPEDLVGFTQCHFFAGIGGWSYALRLAGWPDDRPVWTGSPPCQPFSAAGRQLGNQDERHLAPHFISLVGARRPSMLFGEQVASAAVFGKAAKTSGKQTASPPEWAWFDDLSDRLEAAQYAVGASDIPAASVGAPHIRQRTFFGAFRLADTERKQCEECISRRPEGLRAEGRGATKQPPRLCVPDRLADTDHAGPQRRISGRSDTGWEDLSGHSGRGDAAVGLADAELQQRSGGAPRRDATGGRQQEPATPAGLHGNSGMADATSRSGGDEWEQRSGQYGRQPEHGSGVRKGSGGPQPDVGPEMARSGADHGGWGNPDWLFCRDAKWRPVEPASQRMANGLSFVMGRLRDCSVETKKEVIHAAESSGFRDEVLRALRSGHDKNTLWREIGGRFGFSETTVLFAVLREHSRELGCVFDCEAAVRAQDGCECLQSLWFATPSVARPPQGYEYPEQLAGKLRDALSELSQSCAQFRDVVTDAARFNASPLAEKQPARVMRLRGYGNAIVPQAAAAFIETFDGAAADFQLGDIFG